MTDLNLLLNLPDSQRDSSWERQVLKLLPHSKVTLVSDGPQEGPDGFPYLLVESKPDSQEPMAQVLKFLGTRGIGMVLNPNKLYPDYIFTFGMLWNFRDKGTFLSESPVVAEKILTLEPGQKILAGPPHPQYLPDDIRALLREFLLQQGVFAPKILVVGQDKHFDLCFSLESLGRPVDAEHAGILQALAWFLPADYSLALISEKGLPPFIPL